MKNTKAFITSFAVITALLLTGCIDKPELTPQPAIKPVAPTPSRVHTQGEANLSITSEVSTKLRVAFVNNPEESSFCNKLAQRLTGRVILDKAELLLNTDGDVKITITPEFELKDQSGSYYRVLCKEINVQVASPRKVYAMTTIEPAPLPRQLGMQNAKNQYLNYATNEIAAFLSKELEKISNNEVAVCIVNFALSNANEYASTNSLAAEVSKVAQILSSTSGIINYLNISQNVATATCSFRIVYLRDQFPQGLTNVLNLKLAKK